MVKHSLEEIFVRIVIKKRPLIRKQLETSPESVQEQTLDKKLHNILEGVVKQVCSIQFVCTFCDVVNHYLIRIRDGTLVPLSNA